MTLRDFCYANFGWMGEGLSRVFQGIEQNLDAAYMKMYPGVYLSIISFIALLSLIVPSTLTLFAVIGLWPSLPSIPFNGLFIIPLSAIIPFAIILIGVIIPKIVASNRIS